MRFLCLSHARELCIEDIEALHGIATSFADVLFPGTTVLLSGALGAGKTAFARALIRVLQNDPGAFVPSPTFSLMQEYDTRLGTVWHVDLYRLSEARDVHELGLHELFEKNICLIEWPERMGIFPIHTVIHAHILFGDNPSQRRLYFSAESLELLHF